MKTKEFIRKLDDVGCNPSLISKYRARIKKGESIYAK